MQWHHWQAPFDHNPCQRAVVGKDSACVVEVDVAPRQSIFRRFVSNITTAAGQVIYRNLQGPNLSRERTTFDVLWALVVSRHTLQRSLGGLKEQL